MAERIGTVGMIKPVLSHGELEELIPLLPPGTGYVPVYLNFQRGAPDEFKAAMPTYERLVALLAEQRCDLIHPEGAPPFMYQGLRREAEIVAGWEAKYGIPVFTSGQNHVRALRALGITRFVGATYVSADQTAIFAKYFEEAGFSVPAFESFDVPFEGAAQVPSEQIAAFIRGHVKRHAGVDGIYVLGSGWRVLEVIEPLERELGIPVVYPVVARAWEIQKRLGVRVPVSGYGRLMAELP